MNYIIYADIVFLLNFCMDFLALFAAGKILGLKLSPLRLILSSVFGALYCIFTFICEDFIIPEMVVNIVISVLMCFIAYKITSFFLFSKIFLIFYLACFMLGGGIEAIYYISGFVNTDNITGMNNTDLSMPFQSIIIIAGFCVLIFIFAGQTYKRKLNIKETELVIGLNDNEVKVCTIIDSGNLLYDPISSLPVIVINLKHLINLFEIDTIQLFCGDFVTNISDSVYYDAKKLKFRLIPIKSVNGIENIIPAFIPDYIKYKGRNKKSSGDAFIYINAIIAVDSRDGFTYGEKYGGIVPSVLFE